MSHIQEKDGRCRGPGEALRRDGIQAEVPTARPRNASNASSRLVDREWNLLVAVGSAMAAGCEPCLEQLIPRLIEAGVSDGDIRTAVEIGHRVKEAAAGYMREVADVLAGTRLAGASAAATASGQPSGGAGGCCG